MYTLHGYWRSSSAYRVRCALHLKGLAFETHAVNLIADGGQQYADAYRALNPMAEVPTLELFDASGLSIALGQSVAILEYLEEVHPEVPLLPADAIGRARVRQLVEGVNSGIQPLQNVRVLKRLSASFGADQAAIDDWIRHWIERGFVGLETLVGRHGGRHAFGDRPTLADCMIVPQIYNARRYRLDMTPFPGLARVWDAANALPAFQRAAPEVQPDAPPAAPAPPATR